MEQDKEWNALKNFLINTSTLCVVLFYVMNMSLHAQTGQVVPDSIDYLVPLAALLVLKVGK